MHDHLLRNTMVRCATTRTFSLFSLQTRNFIRRTATRELLITRRHHKASFLMRASMSMDTGCQVFQECCLKPQRLLKRPHPPESVEAQSASCWLLPGTRKNHIKSATQRPKMLSSKTPCTSRTQASACPDRETAVQKCE